MPLARIKSALKQTLRPRFLWNQCYYLTRIAGLRAALRHIFRSDNEHDLREYWIQPRGVDQPLCVRHDSSDVLVLGQIFVVREYSRLDELKDVGLVVDCGANVGYSSAYFLSQYQNCHVVAIEPDSENFSILERNLAHYADRVTLIHAGIWSQPVQLVIEESKYRDGREWSKQVRVSQADETATFEGIDVGSILAASCYDRISLLKMDIEGAEAVVFSTNYQSWLDKVDTIAIELHSDSLFGNGREVFSAAISGKGFECSNHGDLTICVRRG